jgi:hypothetical protein
VKLANKNAVLNNESETEGGDRGRQKLPVVIWCVAEIDFVVKFLISCLNLTQEFSGDFLIIMRFMFGWWGRGISSSCFQERDTLPSSPGA